MTKAPFINQDIPIGTKYFDHKNRECEVIDIYKIYNAANKLVKTRYIVCISFAGQIIGNRDVVKFTIQKALMK